MITSGINFVANGKGTGLYVRLSCYYDNGSSSTPVDLLTSFGDFRVSEGQCADAVTIADPTHPAMAGLTDASLSGWGLHTWRDRFWGNRSRRHRDQAPAPQATTTTAPQADSSSESNRR